MTLAGDLALLTPCLDPLTLGEAPVHRRGDLPNADVLPRRLRDAAVLVPLLADDGGTRVILTRRTRHLRQHAGQVSFPGGRVDRGDASRLAAALREAREEVGLAPERISPLGCLGPVITITGYAMVPFVAAVAPGEPLRPCPGEVDEVFSVPLAHVLDPANHVRQSAVYAGRRRQFYVIRYARHTIWGATAAVLVDLAQRVVGAGDRAAVP